MTVSCGWPSRFVEARVITPDVCFVDRPVGHRYLIDAASAWQGYDVEGYLQRKLHRPWRKRGS